MNPLKKYTEFIKESEVAEPTVKPTIAPPVTTPRRKSPIRRNKPSVNPRPKASAEDVAKRVMELASGEFKAFLDKKYNK